jgi:predicted PurR-regulated permease PerM
MLGTNMVLGNVVEPRIQGRNLGISPFLILASLLLWGWVWGFIGMILAVPMLVIMKLVCDNVDFLNPVGILIGNLASAKTAQSSDKEETV